MAAINTRDTDREATQSGSTVIMVRHAQSQWNLENRFTGWADPPLTATGVAEAEAAGRLLLKYGLRFDAAYSSRQQRAIHTLTILLTALRQTDIPCIEDWRLNERHYGELQGENKAAVAASVGEAQVWRWRRGYRDKAAPLARSDPRHPVHDPWYADLDPGLLPDVENLADTRQRVSGFWRELILPHLRRGKNVLISGHGNTLRALLMELAGMNPAQVESFEIPTAKPILYRFDESGTPQGWEYLENDFASRYSN